MLRKRVEEHLTEQEIKLLSPLGLAYIGDGIYELMVRKRMISKGNMPVQKLHRLTVSFVCAAAQAKAFDILEPILSEEEIAVFKRGRNANGNHIPKNGNPADYRRATGFEAMFGYLYLLERGERLECFVNMIFENFFE